MHSLDVFAATLDPTCEARARVCERWRSAALRGFVVSASVVFVRVRGGAQSRDGARLSRAARSRVSDKFVVHFGLAKSNSTNCVTQSRTNHSSNSTQARRLTRQTRESQSIASANADSTPQELKRAPLVPATRNAAELASDLRQRAVPEFASSARARRRIAK